MHFFDKLNNFYKKSAKFFRILENNPSPEIPIVQSKTIPVEDFHNFFSEKLEPYCISIRDNIFSYLDSDDLAICRLVSKTWKELAEAQEHRKLPYKPSVVFGKIAWAKYFGEVEEEPPLPKNIDEILNADCPFWIGKQVKDTHNLVLVPRTLSGKLFTLKRLDEKLEALKLCEERTIDVIKTRAYEDYKDKPAKKFHWILIAKDAVIKGMTEEAFSENPTIDPSILKMREDYRTYNTIKSRIFIENKKNKYGYTPALDLVVCWFTAFIKSNCKETLFLHAT
jgi:hypothetical protein